MRAIRKRRTIYAVLLTACALLAAGFAAVNMRGAALAFGVAGAVAMILFILQTRTVYDAELICDNPILRVPSAVLSDLESAKNKTVEETVISAFGALVGGRVYKWGCDGLGGSRLESIEMDREKISLTFGNRAKTLNLELLHGLDNAQKAERVKQDLFHETGVKTMVSGW